MKNVIFIFISILIIRIIVDIFNLYGMSNPSLHYPSINSKQAEFESEFIQLAKKYNKTIKPYKIFKEQALILMFVTLILFLGIEQCMSIQMQINVCYFMN